MNSIKQPTLDEITVLLQNNDLPCSDIKDLKLDNFFGYYLNNTLEGIVGLEVYGNVALLRSLAVNHKKSSGIGSKLLLYVDDYALENSIDTLYLLTTTADKYFLKKGFKVLDKDEAPKSIQNTQEFNSICPASSVFMKKEIKQKSL